MPSASPHRQPGSSGGTRQALDQKCAVHRSLQQAAEDIKAKLSSEDDVVKDSVRDAPDSMREQALSSCRTPAPAWRDSKRPSNLQMWNAYWEKDYYCKHESEQYFYKSHSGRTRSIKLDPFSTIGEVKGAIEQHQGAQLMMCYKETLSAPRDCQQHLFAVENGCAQVAANHGKPALFAVADLLHQQFGALHTTTNQHPDCQ